MSEPTPDHKLRYEPPAAPRVIGGVSAAANNIQFTPFGGDGQYGYASLADIAQG